MPSITLTSKRQVTFPRETCEAMGLKPGDIVDLESRQEAGSRIWVLRPRTVPDRKWLACLGSRAQKVTDHSMEAVRRSIAAGRKDRP